MSARISTHPRKNHTPAWCNGSTIWNVCWRLSRADGNASFGKGTGIELVVIAVPLDSFARFAIDDLRHGHHGGHGAAEGALAATLTNPATHLASALPVDFANLENTGCRTLHFAGRDVLEVCFHRAGAEFHFYILPRGTLRGTDGPHSLELGGVSALAWNDARYVYAVIGETGAQTLRHLL